MSVTSRPPTDHSPCILVEGAPTDLLRETATARMLQLAESLELPVVLERVARHGAMLFEGVCRVRFTPAYRPADALQLIAGPDMEPAWVASAQESRTYAELLAQLQEQQSARASARSGPEAWRHAAEGGQTRRPAPGSAELLLAPLIARGHRIGIIDVVRPVHEETTLAHSNRLLRELAAHAALAIDTADRFAQRGPATRAASDPAPGNGQGPPLALVIHDLRGPLATLSNSIQLLVRETSGAAAARPDVVARLLEVAGTAVGQLETQIIGLSPPSAQGARSNEPPVEPIDLVRLVQLLANFYEQTTARHRITVRAEVSQLCGLWARAHIERALGNLILNGIKYSVSGGEVSITVDREDDALGSWATVCVENTGIGIPLSALSRLTELGYRAENVGMIRGTGLGLASVREIVAQYGGTFAAQSTEDGRTSVLVRLPLIMREGGQSAERTDTGDTRERALGMKGAD